MSLSFYSPLIDGSHPLPPHSPWSYLTAFSQDPLENYSVQVRAQGWRCENPTIKAALESAQSLHVQGSYAMQPVRRNSSRKQWLFKGQGVIHVDEAPLPKRTRSNK